MTLLDHPPTTTAAANGDAAAGAGGGAEDLTALGIHRDPAVDASPSRSTFAQRAVDWAARALAGKRTSRRSFLTKTAVVGSALAVGPVDFLLKPGTAYGYVCGTCTDGWTAFCCTINGGNNTCPPGSFIAGWWKADRAAYCCGSARYIIDCNATCPTQCRCRCAGGSCDGRKTCCNQFRYGQCHQEIACYGPVVCRVATCTVPWEYDPSCTRASATDNRTRDHGAPCLTTDCASGIAAKYAALGGAGGRLGPVTVAEAAVGDGRGRVARYRNGAIFWTSSTGAFALTGAVLAAYDAAKGPRSELGYPTGDERGAADRKSRYANFERGRIYEVLAAAATFIVPAPFFAKHEATKGVYGALGYPTGNPRAAADGRSRYQNYERGRIYLYGGRTIAVPNPSFAYHEANGGIRGPLKYPQSDYLPLGDGIGSCQFYEGGTLWSAAGAGTHGLTGAISERFLAGGHVTGPLHYPTGEETPVGDGRGTYAEFQGGRIYATATTGAHEVRGTILRYYLERGGPTGSLGYPTTELDPKGTAGGRFQRFEKGRIQYNPDASVTSA